MENINVIKQVLFIACVCILSILCYLKPACAQRPDDIVNAIYQLRKQTFEDILQESGFETIPAYYSMRIYKEDGELEIWAGMDDKSELKKLVTYPICAMDFMPGTKLRQGDERTPEGSFELTFLYRSSNWFMHTNLNNLLLPGNVSRDPSFFMCTDYPTAFDKKLAGSVGIKNPGNAICVHGNCVSVGCASMKNSDYIEIYYWMMQHQAKKYGAPRVHILPFRFYVPCRTGVEGFMRYFTFSTFKKDGERFCPSSNNTLMEYLAMEAESRTPESQILGKDKIEALWNHIKNREQQFLMNPIPANAELEMSMDILNNLK